MNQVNEMVNTTPPAGGPSSPQGPEKSHTLGQTGKDFEDIGFKKWGSWLLTNKEYKEIMKNVMQALNSEIQKDKDKSIKALRKLREENPDEQD